MKKILVVEDELEIRQLLASYLRNEGFSVSEAEDGVVKKGVAFDGLAFYEEDMHYYGGFYVNKNVYIEVFSLNGSEKERKIVDLILKQLKLPKP